MIKPLFEEVNALRGLLLCILFIVLEESMYGFCPKTSPYGGFPNIMYRPRKPVNLGAMVRNGLDAITGIFAFRDPVLRGYHEPMSEGVHAEQEFTQSNNGMHTPGGGDLSVATAEVLRQVKGSGLVKGSWVCGDAWFGSSVSVIELKIWLGVFSSECWRV